MIRRNFLKEETDEIDVTDTQALAEAKKRISEPIPFGEIFDPMYGFNWVSENKRQK